MKLEITVTEVTEIIRSLPEQSEPFFETMRFKFQQAVSEYLEAVMLAELRDWLGRERYARAHG